MDRKIDLFTIYHEDSVKASLIDSILKYCRIRFSKSPQSLDGDILEKLDIYLCDISDIEEIYEIQSQFFDCDDIDELRQLVTTKINPLKEEPEIVIPYYKQGMETGMITATLQYLKIRFSNSPIAVDEELIEQLGVYLEYLSLEELEDTQKTFFRCTDDKELYDLVISKLDI